MPFFNRIKFLVLLGVALVLIGFSGCAPGPIVWRADVSPMPSRPQETAP
jgi:hypothetical protein